MNISIDAKAGTVTMSVADFLDLAGKALTAGTALDKLFSVSKALRTSRKPAQFPYVHTYHVGAYTQAWVVDAAGAPYWVCSCDDFRFRQQAPEGEAAWMNGSCKHIVLARVEDAQANDAHLRSRARFGRS